MLAETIQGLGGVKVDQAPVKNPASQASADEYNRVLEYVAQMSRTVPRVMASFPTTLAANPVLTDHATVWGSGIDQTPTIVRTGAGVYTVTFAASYLDGLNVSENVSFLFGWGNVAGATFAHPQVEVTSAAVLTLRLFDAAGVATDAGGGVLVTVFAR
jgi:hypothetical protein